MRCPTLAEYTAYCHAVDILVENFFHIFPQPDGSNFIYRNMRFPRLLFNCAGDYFSRKYLEWTGDYYHVIPYGDGKHFEAAYHAIIADPFIYEFYRKCIKAYGYCGGYGCIRLDPDKLISEYDTHSIWSAFKYLFSFSDVSGTRLFKRGIPFFREENGILYFWDMAFNISRFNGDLDKVALFQKGQPYPKRYVFEESDSLEQKVVKNYFTYHPEQQERFYAQIAEYYEKVKQAEAANQACTQNIKVRERAISKAQQTIDSATADIHSLEKKIFGKKKAAERIETLRQTITEQTAQIQALQSDIALLEKSIVPEPESEVDFGQRMAEEWNYFIVWHPVQ